MRSIFDCLKKAVGSITKPLIVFLFFFTPYIAIAADRYAFMERGYLAFGGEMVVPILCYMLMYALMAVDEELNPKKGGRK